MKHQKRMLTPENAKKIVKDVLARKKTLANSRGITNEQMEACYTAAYNFYKQGNFIEALDVFTKLCMLDILNAKYWLGLGASRQMLKDYSGAVEAYIFASASDLTNPQPHFHNAQCLLALKEHDRAIKHLKTAISIVVTSKTEKKEHKAIAEGAKNLLETLAEKESAYI